MNILLVHQYFLEKEDPGGSRFNEMTKTWEEEGHTITVLAGMIHANASNKSPKYKGKYFMLEQYSQGIRVLRCHVSESYNKNFAGRLWGYFSFVFFATWAGLFKAKGKYDLVLVTSPPLFVGITGYLLSRLKRIPLVFEIRDLWPESAIDTGVVTNGFIIRLSYWLEGFIYKKSSLINVLTPAFREALITGKKVAPEKIIFIPNAADFSLSEPLLKSFDREVFRLSLGLKPTDLVIIYVGAHGVANHLIQVLDTAELMKDEPAVFLLLGDGMERKSLMEEAAKRGLVKVRFLPPVAKQEVFNYILAADLGASVLKKVDTFKTVYSNKTFDYMSCQKPILMAIDGVSRALVEEADAGKYVEPENPQDFADKIRFYLQHPDEIKRQGENGYRFAHERFDRRALAKEYMQQLMQHVQKRS